jgi:hypothetical protein
VALETPIWIEAASGDAAITLSARQYRTVPDAIWASEGVVGSGDLTVSQRAAGANMSVDVSAGMVVILGEGTTNQGKYVMRNTGVYNVTVAAAPASGTRTDLIVAQLYDKQADGSSQYGWDIVSVANTTTPPPSSVALARIALTSTTTSIANSIISITGRQFAQAHRVVRPTSTAQVSMPSFTTFGTFVDFTSGQWPPLTATFPASGLMWVTLSGNIFNVNTTTSTIWITFRVSSGAGTWSGDNALSAAGGRVFASRRTLVSGTPLTSITFTPRWNVSSDGGATLTSIDQGVIVAEPVM